LKTLESAALANGDIHGSCMEGTRLSILQKARSWMNDETTEQVFWLADVAGSGKSTVASHLAREWYSNNKLAGRFFFSREAEQTRTTTYFFSTIAQQGLARIGLQVQREICHGIRELREPVAASLKEQCEALFVRPLKRIKSSMVLVLDALDECDQRSFLQLFEILLPQLHSLPHIRLFLTSRPEHHIAKILNEQNLCQTPLTENQETNLSDVDHFMAEKLRSLSVPETRIGQLVARSNGLFIWASTVCKIFEDFQGDEDEFLESLMSQGPQKMNQVYHVALKQALSTTSDEAINLKAYKRFFEVIVVAFEPLSPKSINSLLQITSASKIVGHLRSVLVCHGPDEPVRFLHPTFREFLLEHLDNHPCHVEERNAHLLLAQACLETMSRTLKWDLCDLFNIPVDKIKHVWKNEDQRQSIKDDWNERCQQRLKKHTDPDVLYSSIFWGQHIESCQTIELAQGDAIYPYLQHFFSANMLDWMYLLSFIKSIKDPWKLLGKLVLAEVSL
jgi:hypothetical protein